MDMEQEEMQFLGLIGICRESFKLIFKCRKIFSQITFALILPLCIIFLAYQEVSEILYYKIRFNEFRLKETQSDTPKHHGLADLVSSEWAAYILLKAVYLAFVLAFSLLSTAAVVYTIAAVYTCKEFNFRKVISVVPRVWKRLIVTLLSVFLAVFTYNVAFGVVLYVWRVTLGEWEDHETLATVIVVIIVVFYAAGFVYMTIIWQLASVVSVMEEVYGFRAMMRSRALIKGKMAVAALIFFKLNAALVIANFLFSNFVIGAYWRRNWDTVAIGISGFCLLLLLVVFLFGLVVQTVIYFVCKSYHHENIDKSVLSDHLDVYLGDYEPLKGRDVQMGDYRV